MTTFGWVRIFAAVVAERIHPRAGFHLLVPFMLLGAASVLYWRWSGLSGQEDVLPYAVVQFGSLVTIILIALVYPPRYTQGAYLFSAAALYALAKGAEALDAEIYALGHLVSGHTVKHFMAAGALWWLLRMIEVRRPR